MTYLQSLGSHGNVVVSYRHVTPTCHDTRRTNRHVAPRCFNRLHHHHGCKDILHRRSSVSTCASPLADILSTSPLVSDLAATTMTFVAGVLAVSSIKWLENTGVLHKTVSRKLVHSIAGPGFLAFWPLFGDTFMSQCIASATPALNGLSLFLAGTRLVSDTRSVSAISRSGDPRELLRGPLYYTIVLTLVTLFLWRGSLVSIAVVSIMCGGDGLADLVGRALGKNAPLPWNPRKSWPGTLAMFLGGFAMAYILTVYFSYFGFVSYTSTTLWNLASIAAIASILESLPIHNAIDDNISVPILVASCGYFML